MMTNSTRVDDYSGRLNVTPWLMVKSLFAVVLGVVLVLMAEGPIQLLVAIVLVPIVTLGLIGRHGLTSDESRLPSALQGVCVGVYVGVAVAAVVLDAWNWTIVAWIFPLAVLFPNVIPAKIRRPFATKMAVHEDVAERTR